MMLLSIYLWLLFAMLIFITSGVLEHNELACLVILHKTTILIYDEFCLNTSGQ